MNLGAALLAITLPRMIVFVLALARVGGLFMVAPILGSRTAPVRVRAAVAFFLALAMLPAIPAEAATAIAVDAGPIRLFAALSLEVAIGFTVGTVAQFVFGGVQMAGQLAGIQMGVGLSNLIDPQTQEHVTALAQWQNLLALLVFLAVDGHHLLIRAIAESFTLVPIGGGFPTTDGLGRVLVLAGSIFVIALRVAAPIIVMLLLINGAMAVLAKLIPQLNVFVVSFPLHVGVGLLMLAASQPFTVRLLETSFAEMSTTLAGIMRAMH
ncbi:MAG: flagellar biosynthetic protein FliR [Deltaproteobacteria bacterium]|nr:MAG: flagellar biosynthetic protein FliR [Deltaproteobacteria bacterium]